MTAETRQSHAEYTLEIPIAAEPATVWRCLTEETNGWWLPDFHMVGAGSTVTFDARAGGQLVEQLEGGGSLLWFTVTWVEPGKHVELVGHLSPDYGGPATSMLRFELEATETGTLFKVRDALVGHLSPTLAQSLNDGWAWLFRDGLAPYCAKA